MPLAGGADLRRRMHTAGRSRQRRSPACLAIQNVEKTLDVVDLDSGSTVKVGRDYAEGLVVNGPTKTAANGSIHDLAMRTPRSTAFASEGVSDVVVQRERGSC